MARDDAPIAFVSSRDGTDAIYLAKEDGSVVRRLTNGFGPSWSPDGTKIAFWRYLETSPPAKLYVINADGTGERLISSAGAAASWSPDGTKLLYSTPVGTPNGGIMVSNADGSNRRLLLSNDFNDPGTGDWLGYPSWSPDGTLIAFVRSNYEKGSQIFLMNADGSSPHVLSGLLAADDPSWSPDGRTLAFTTYLSVGTINPDGTGYRIYDPAWAFDPDWSPDGTRLIYNAFAVVTASAPYGTRMRIFVLDRATGAMKQMIPDVASPVKADYRDEQPAWRRAKNAAVVH